MSSPKNPYSAFLSSPTSAIFSSQTFPFIARTWRNLLIKLLITGLFLNLIFFPFSQSQEVFTSSDPAYYYNLCSTSTCGNLSSIPYPFAFPSFCGHPDVEATCADNDYLLLASNNVPQMNKNRVVSNFTLDAASIAVKVAFQSLFGCGPATRKNSIIGATPFSLSNDYKYGTHLNCTQRPASGSLEPSSCLGCRGSSAGSNLCFYTPTITSFPECENFLVFVREEVNVSNIGDLREYLRRGYEIRYTKSASCRSCENTKGRCGSSPKGDFMCYCPTSAHRLNCTDGMAEDLRTWLPKDGKSKISKGVIAAISVSASVASLVILATIVAICAIRRKSKSKGDQEVGDDGKTRSRVSFKIRGLVSGISPKRYSYAQLKKFTADFSTKLGEGGYGSVYKGLIQGSGAVAIKVLGISEQSKKQFMNEVSTVGRVHHQNLVRLLGYCAQGKTRALVYEFMEKGSLDKYIYDKDHGQGKEREERISSLTLRQMYNIALETARGILYLHEGCRSRILHLDIKPHNVLIDSNLTAKVADFGLARLMDKDHSHVSLTNAQGTPGYAAPEMWTKTHGPITDKADVYSFGMLLLEMAGRRKNYDLGAENTSQRFFPEWVFKRAQRGELKVNPMINEARSYEADENVNQEEEVEKTKEQETAEIFAKMCLVGLWCIQHIPSNRPTMSKVIEMLEGNVEIEIPPQPFPMEFSSEDFPSCYFTAHE